MKPTTPLPPRPKTLTKVETVLVTGVFDVLHRHHFGFLQAASRSGKLMVGVESDSRVRQIKGETRPVRSLDSRLMNLQSLFPQAQVFGLPEKFSSPEDHRRLIAELKPAILAVSAHTNHLAAKRQILAEFGGRVEIVYPHYSKLSSSLIISQWVVDDWQGERILVYRGEDEVVTETGLVEKFTDKILSCDLGSGESAWPLGLLAVETSDQLDSPHGLVFHGPRGSESRLGLQLYLSSENSSNFGESIKLKPIALVAEPRDCQNLNLAVKTWMDQMRSGRSSS